jgi:glycine/D-amino acid oxidase-like deaminating enzyme
MYSFWEKKELVNFDCIILGGGFVGLSTAVSLAEKKSGLRIALVERAYLPQDGGAKASGIISFASLSETVSDVEEFGEENALELIHRRYEGFRMLRERFADEQIDMQIKGGYELFSDDEMPILEKLSGINQKLFDYFETDIFRLCAKTQVNSFGFSTRHVKHIVKNPFEAQLDTGKLLRELQKKAGELGISIISGISNLRIEHDSRGARLSAGENHFFAKKIADCTNDYVREFLPDEQTKTTSDVLWASKPLRGLTFKGAFRYKSGSLFFRDYYGRLIAGYTESLSKEDKNNQKSLEYLTELLHAVIVPGQKLETEKIWNGGAFFHTPFSYELLRSDEHIVVCSGKHSSEIALCTLLGDELSDMMLGELNMP